MKTRYASHYQAVTPLRYKDLSFDKPITLEELLFNLALPSADKEITLGYFIDSEEGNIETWGVVELTTSHLYFPTAPADDTGAIVSYMGKTFFVWFDEDFKLNIGHNGEIYCFMNGSFIEDATDLFNVIFMGVLPSEADNDWDEN